MRSGRLATLAAVLIAATGCGSKTTPLSNSSGPQLQAPALHGHPQAVNPTLGEVGGTAAAGGASVVSVGPPVPGLPAPLSDAQVRKQLAASGLAGRADRATLTPQGLAIAPTNAPAAVKVMIEAGNAIAHLPYRWGGGHATFQDTGFDCSGSLSYVFAAAGLLSTSVTSGQLMSMGDPGPGRWVTVYATQGHTFMYVAGLRFDTVALAQTGSRWSDRPANEPDLASFVVRHPPTL